MPTGRHLRGAGTAAHRTTARAPYARIVARDDVANEVERLVTVMACSSRVQAQLARGALATEGVRAVVLSDDAGGVHPQLALTSNLGVRVAVPDHEVDRARAVLGELEAGVHALPTTGDHERDVPPRGGNGPAFVVLGLLAALLVYRVAVMVWPGLG